MAAMRKLNCITPPTTQKQAVLAPTTTTLTQASRPLLSKVAAGKCRVLRRLPNLDDHPYMKAWPLVTKPHISEDTGMEYPARPMPQAASAYFLKLLRDTRMERGGEARYRGLLINAHVDFFGVPPEHGISLEIVKTRCAYRLAAEGHRLSGVPMPERVRQNYEAMMRFTCDYEGMVPADAVLRRVITQIDGGKVTMKAIKKVQIKTGATLKDVLPRVVKQASTPKSEPKQKPVGGKHKLVMGKYSITELIRYMAKVFDATFKQIEVAIEKLHAHSVPTGTRAQMWLGKTGKRPIPTLTKDEVVKLRAMLPSVKAAPKKITAKK